MVKAQNIFILKFQQTKKKKNNSLKHPAQRFLLNKLNSVYVFADQVECTSWVKIMIRENRNENLITTGNTKTITLNYHEIIIWTQSNRTLSTLHSRGIGEEDFWIKTYSSPFCWIFGIGRYYRKIKQDVLNQLCTEELFSPFFFFFL